MSIDTKIGRREFLKTGAALGGGLVIACYVPLLDREAFAKTAAEFAPNAFLRISGDGTVTVLVNKSEMGQGIYTSLPMLVAEELECDWEKIRIEAAPVAAVYNHTVFGLMVTGGSSSVWSEWDRLSGAGAAARQLLIAAAAKKWRVDPASCRAENSLVLGPAGRIASYGELAADTAKLATPKEVALKSPQQYRLLGKPVHRTDSPAKIAGSAVFGIDVQVPGMLTAVIARPPVFGAKLKNVNADKAGKVRGVREVLTIPAGVAVVADDFWSAKSARELLELTWEDGQWGELSTPGMRAQYAKLAATPGLPARTEGDADAALSRAVKRLDAEYEVPYLSHSPMEPLNCFVDLKPDSCLIRTGSQFQTVDRDAAARTAGLKPEQVTLETTFLGGGFGRRANPASDFVIEAVQVARALKKPVKVVWTREDDLKGGYYRPMWFDRISAGIDASGTLSAWKHTIVGQSIIAGTSFEKALIKNGIDDTSVEGAADIPYHIPNLLVDLHTTKNGVPTLWWRSVGHSHTAFVVESFLDEVAAALGKDPYYYRRELLAAHPRQLGVLDAAAKLAGWGKPLPAGHGMGIAVHESFKSFVAQVAEVSLDDKGAIRVHRVYCAVDCGKIVNPDTIAAQMESGITFGLSAALYGAITLKNGRVEQSNFDAYPVVRLDAMPRVEVQIVKSSEKPGGVGETGVPPIAPAVANALFAASGARVRALPMTPERIKTALAKG
jgi:isoquinoline 1-oxidoreductase subunit beta